MYVYIYSKIKSKWQNAALIYVLLSYKLPSKFQLMATIYVNCLINKIGFFLS